MWSMEERRMRTEDNAQAKLYEALMATAYQTHPYRHPVIGWMDDLKNMTVDDARRWYENWYSPNNATLVVAGDVDPAAGVWLGGQYFGAIAERAICRTQAATRAGADRHEAGYRARRRPSCRWWRWSGKRPAGDPANDWEPYALEILAGVLDGHASARLNQSLVRDKRIANDASAGYDAIARGPGMFSVDASPVEGQTVAVVQAALEGGDCASDPDGVSETELNRVKAQVLASQVYQQDSLFYQAMQIGEWTTAGLDYKARDTRFAKLKAVTAEQVRDVAKKYLVDDRLTVAVLDPLPMPEGKPAFQRNLIGGGHGR
jgi:zinc protease